MIRNPSKRMTVAQLEQRMDRRFAEVDKRFDAVDERFEAVDRRFGELEHRLSARIDLRYESISDKLDSIARSLKANFDHHEKTASKRSKPGLERTELERQCSKSFR